MCCALELIDGQSCIIYNNNNNKTIKVSKLTLRDDERKREIENSLERHGGAKTRKQRN